MKKLILLFVLLLTFTIVGCGNKTNVTVSFDSKGGTEVADIEVEKGSTIQKPASPEKEGYIFVKTNCIAGSSMENTLPGSFNRCSAPSELKITDVRFTDIVGAPMRIYSRTKSLRISSISESGVRSMESPFQPAI